MRRLLPILLLALAGCQRTREHAEISLLSYEPPVEYLGEALFMLKNETRQTFHYRGYGVEPLHSVRDFGNDRTIGPGCLQGMTLETLAPGAEVQFRCMLLGPNGPIRVSVSLRDEQGEWQTEMSPILDLPAEMTRWKEQR